MLIGRLRVRNGNGTVNGMERIPFSHNGTETLPFLCLVLYMYMNYLYNEALRCKTLGVLLQAKAMKAWPVTIIIMTVHVDKCMHIIAV